jgi:hypothetical protein
MVMETGFESRHIRAEVLYAMAMPTDQVGGGRSVTAQLTTNTDFVTTA